MSGEGRKTIHKETGNGGWPNGLTVDYLERRILWIDARSYIDMNTLTQTPLFDVHAVSFSHTQKLIEKLCYMQV